MRIWFFFFFFSLTSWSQEAFRFQVQPIQGLSQKQQEVVQQFYDHVASMLPPLMKERIASPVEIIFTSFNTDKYGESTDHRIWVNQDLLLPVILKGPNPSEKSPRKRLPRTLYEDAIINAIHEVTHVYDWINFQSKQEKGIIQQCESWQANTVEFQSLPRLQLEQCQSYLKSRYTVSDRPYFLTLSGWNHLEKNGHTHRSPDPYEFKKDSAEFFAVNVPLFLLESDFACRRPTIYRFLSEHFQYRPFPNQVCDQNLHFLIPVGSRFLQFELNPSRVYQIHYLQAGPGEEAMSRWGHSMLRVIMCAPLRKEVNQECLKDLSFHFVISFRAFIDSFQMSPWKGLRGQYPSRLFLLPLSQLIEEYNFTELRDMRSYPLKISRQEMHQILIRANEYHWDYDGKYYFLGNNCADETLELVRSAVQRPYLESMVVHTPDDLRSQWQSLGFLDLTVFQGNKKDKEKGYFFESYRTIYQKIFQELVLLKNSALKNISWENFLQMTSDARRKVYEDLKLKNPELRLKTASSFYLFESHSARLLRRKIITSLQDFLQQETLTSSSLKQEEWQDAKKSSLEESDKVVKMLDLMSAPYRLLVQSPRYGIPTKSELEQALSGLKQEDNMEPPEKESQQTEKKWKDFVSKLDPKSIQELDSSEAQIRLYSQESSSARSY